MVQMCGAKGNRNQNWSVMLGSWAHMSSTVISWNFPLAILLIHFQWDLGKRNSTLGAGIIYIYYIYIYICSKWSLYSPYIYMLDSEMLWNGNLCNLFFFFKYIGNAVVYVGFNTFWSLFNEYISNIFLVVKQIVFP